MHECTQCGFPTDGEVEFCPKCDEELKIQTDGSSITIDIAHSGETIPEALDHIRTSISHEKLGLTKQIKFITGKGEIRDKAWQYLAYLKHGGEIANVSHEGNNDGVIIAQIKR